MKHCTELMLVNTTCLCAYDSKMLLISRLITRIRILEEQVKLPKNFLSLDYIAKMSADYSDTFVKAEKHNAVAT